jgi:excisionase family DNA binding protein
MTTEQAGEYLGVSGSRIRQFIREGRLPKRKFGNANVIPRPAVEDLKRKLIEEAPRKRGPKPNVMRPAPPPLPREEQG